jgi:hypothetical protein
MPPLDGARGGGCGCGYYKYVAPIRGLRRVPLTNISERAETAATSSNAPNRRVPPFGNLPRRRLTICWAVKG